MTVISLRGATRRYAGVTVLDAATLTAPSGKVLALLGPSGSGKSTILRLIAGLEPLDAGDIRIGEEIVSTTERTLAPERRRIGVVFQDYALFPHLSALANVAFGLAALVPDARRRQALAWLERVGLAARAEAYPHELSGGEQQRVALARALAPAPRAVLLDEPFSGLDPVLRGELRDTALGALADSGVTTIFVTHDAEEALLVADRLVILKQGRVLQEAAPREAYNHPASVDVAAALGSINIFDGVVVQGAIATPFGLVMAPHLPDGAPGRAVVRVEALALTPGTGARLLERRPHGAHDFVRIGAQGAIWRALVPARTPPADAYDVVIDPVGAFAFTA